MILNGSSTFHSIQELNDNSLLRGITIPISSCSSKLRGRTPKADLEATEELSAQHTSGSGPANDRFPPILYADTMLGQSEPYFKSALPAYLRCARHGRLFRVERTTAAHTSTRG